MHKSVLENRLVEFSTRIVILCRTCAFDDYTRHLSIQIARSSSSAALNYGEAQSAESRADFSHKMSIVLKELRETFINLKLIQKSKISKNEVLLEELMKENNELIAIFQSSIKTLQKPYKK